ncbi:MAG: Asp-tRNA(Asn)/Glu-tRNA(Gln) amidotransferase subunit GatB [Actinobacteria bacterium]|nr:Asp-tRNA(Asn)/Glu-tRNA(Gln) amidotransferase subunit GatB [Actinomycetota bacterium]
MSMSMSDLAGYRGYEPVIGLEVHCELDTVTKMFCGCPNSFGDAPNTNICPVCLALPGSLPVVNEMAVEFAARIGLALHCEVRPSIFHRKNYFYPDMPKDYQISQYDEPINVNGWLELPASGVRIGIERAHMEEDTGKTTHVGGGGRIHDSSFSLVDYNRAGVPLVEIVSRPDIRSSEQARQYVSELRMLLVSIGASKARMEEGSLRVDANVSVRPTGSGVLGTRCEIKNLNSLRSLVRAIEYEIERQVDLVSTGQVVVQQTRHWDEAGGRTIALRSKEEAHDYRYFPEPDLVRLDFDSDRVARIAGALPPTPEQRRARIISLFDAPTGTDLVATIVEMGLDVLVISAIEHGVVPERALSRTANEAAARVEDALNLDPGLYARLLMMEQEGKLTPTQTKAVLQAMMDSGGEPESIASTMGFEAMDSEVVADLVSGIVDANPDEWQRYRDGEGKLAQFFVGQVMKATRGKASGKEVIAALDRLKAGAK